MERLPVDEALVKIRLHLNHGSIMYTKHFKDRLRDRNISMQDVAKIIKSGTIKKEPEQDLETEEWKYRIDGFDIEGVETSIIASIVSEKTSKFITVF